MRDTLDRFPFFEVNKLGFVWLVKPRQRPYLFSDPDCSRIQQRTELLNSLSLYHPTRRLFRGSPASSPPCLFLSTKAWV